MAFDLFRGYVSDTATKPPSPSDVMRRQKLAETILADKIEAKNPLGVLANALSGSLAGYENRQASDMETAGREKASSALAEALRGGGTFDSLAAVSSDPWLNQNQSALANTLLGKEIDKKYAPGPDPFTLGKGDRRFNGDGTLMAEGIPDSPDTVIENNIGGTDKFYDKLDEGLATDTVGLITQGRNAQGNNARLGQLENLLTQAPQGAQGVITQFAGNIGIPLDGLDEIQAAQAIINQMVPGQRPPGSGTMSDADLALFKASLPSIINQPGGNTLIIQTAKAINDYTIEQARIAEQVANREISPAEGRERQRNIPNPLQGFSGAKSAPQAAPPQADAGVDDILKGYGL